MSGFRKQFQTNNARDTCSSARFDLFLSRNKVQARKILSLDFCLLSPLSLIIPITNQDRCSTLRQKAKSPMRVGSIVLPKARRSAAQKARSRSSRSGEAWARFQALARDRGWPLGEIGFASFLRIELISGRNVVRKGGR